MSALSIPSPIGNQYYRAIGYLRRGGGNESVHFCVSSLHPSQNRVISRYANFSFIKSFIHSSIHSLFQEAVNPIHFYFSNGQFILYAFICSLFFLNWLWMMTHILPLFSICTPRRDKHTSDKDSGKPLSLCLTNRRRDERIHPSICTDSAPLGRRRRSLGASSRH